MIRKNAERVEENNYSFLQRKAWKNQNKPKAIINRLEKRIIFCAFQNDKMIGTIGLEGNLLCGMYISPSKRGKGIGQKLLNHLEKYAREIKITELKLTASPNGYGFYLKNAFKPYGKIELEFEGVKFIETKMRKNI